MCQGANKTVCTSGCASVLGHLSAAKQVVGTSARCAKHLLGPAAVRLTAIRPRSTGTSIVNSAWRAANGCGPIAGNYEAASTGSAKSAEPTAPLRLLLQFAFPASKAVAAILTCPTRRSETRLTGPGDTASSQRAPTKRQLC